MTRGSKRREDLICIIRGSPGIQFRELMRRTGIKNGALSNHLYKIEKAGTIKVERLPRQTRYYPPGISDLESNICKSLRRGTPRRIIIEMMLDRHGLTFGDVVSRVAKSPSTVSVYLSQLVSDGVVEMFIENRKKMYRIGSRDLVNRLIDKYHPGMLDEPTSGMEEIFSSL